MVPRRGLSNVISDAWQHRWFVTEDLRISGKWAMQPR
jgi:hypothetical protein